MGRLDDIICDDIKCEDLHPASVAGMDDIKCEDLYPASVAGMDAIACDDLTYDNLNQDLCENVVLGFMI